MRVLVTGSSGHVGGAIAEHLDTLGWEVVGLSRTLRHPLPSYHQITADISLPSFVEDMKEIPLCNVIVHAAASLDKNLYEPSISLTNCLGTQNLLRLAEHWQVAQFIYISSVPVIGAPKFIPITEEHPLAPPSAYHASKLFSEFLVTIFRTKGYQASILRLPSPVGLGMPRSRIFSQFAHNAHFNQPLQVLGQGTRCQNYIDVRDVGIAAQQCIESNANDLFLIGGVRAISNYNLALLCIEVLQSTSKIHFIEQPDMEEGVIWDISADKAAVRIGYYPHFTIEDSIRSVVSA